MLYFQSVIKFVNKKSLDNSCKQFITMGSRRASMGKRTSKKYSLSLGNVFDALTDTGRSHILSNDASSLLDHSRGLDINTTGNYIRLSSIICTIGPASREVYLLERMMSLGMNIARLNFSHGSQEYHLGTIVNLRQAVENYSSKLGMLYPMAIAIDTKGPEIRTGTFDGGPALEIELKKGDILKLTIDKTYIDKGTSQCIYVDYGNLIKTVKVGNKIYIDDGLICLHCTNVGSNFLTCQVDNGGILGGHKGVNLPGINVDLPTLSERDKNDLKFAVDNGVDIIFASFIRSAYAIDEIRTLLGEKGKKIRVIAKIEDQDGMANLDEIIEASDGVMVARGDLGIEIPPEKVFLAQKTIIARCNLAGKPVICATQMLESMVKKPRPTRAEGSDVANAILDGADCVMLSSETAKGDYPLESVLTMAKYCREAEAAVWSRQHFGEVVDKVLVPVEAAHAVAIATVQAACKTLATAIIVVTSSGVSAHLLSMYRPRCPIIAVTRAAQVARQCRLYRGIVPILYEEAVLNDWLKEVDARVQFGLKYTMSNKFVEAGDPVLIVTGWKQGTGFTNTMRIIYVSPERTPGFHPEGMVLVDDMPPAVKSEKASIPSPK